MIKKVMVIAFAVVPFIAFGQEDYTIKGEAGKLNTPAKVFMIYNNAGQRVIDSAEIKDGVFAFSGTVEAPMQGVLVLDREGTGLQVIRTPDMISFYLEKGTIGVNTPDSLSQATLSGTPLNEDQQQLNVRLKETKDQSKALMTVYRNATDEERAAEGYVDQIQEKYEAIEQASNVRRFEFIKENPNSLVSLLTLLESAGPTPEFNEIAPLLTGLSAELQATPQGKALAEQLEVAKKVAIGAMAPEFTQNDTLGNPISLASFRGKYVLLDFWASWCGPCRQENPNIVAAHQAYKDKNFTVLGISLDRENDKEKWMKAIHDDNLAWTQVSDLKFWQNEAAQLYGIRAIPQSYLLDPEGRIIAKNLRGKALHEALAELLD